MYLIKQALLQRGVFKVVSIIPDGVSKDELLQTAAYAENYSSHPIALSIKEAYGKEINSSEIKEVNEVAGNGVKAVVNGEAILVGSSRLLETYGINIKDTECSGTVVYVAANNKYLGYIVIADKIKEDAGDAIESLKKLARQTVMLTGDIKETADTIGRKLGIDKIYSQLLPAQKVEKLEGNNCRKAKKSQRGLCGRRYKRCTCTYQSRCWNRNGCNGFRCRDRSRRYCYYGR